MGARLSDLRNTQLPWQVVVGLSTFWLILDGVIISPDFGQTDIYYFKDAGINFASGLGLTSRFTYGNPSFNYLDYAHYPPLYPLLFGFFVKTFGISTLSNQLFNSLIALAAGLEGFLVLRPMLQSAVRGQDLLLWETILATASLSTGYFYFSYDRPDGLAVVFAVAAVTVALRGRTPWTAVIAGACCALGLFTSPFTGAWTASAAACVLLTMKNMPWQLRLHRLTLISLSGLAVSFLILSLIWWHLPGWFNGFLGVATGAETKNETGGGYFLALLHGHVRTWLSGFSYTQFGPLILLLKLCTVVGALLFAVWRTMTRLERAHIVPCVCLLVLAPLPLILVPYQSNYSLVTAAMLLATWAGVGATYGAADRQRAHAIAILVAFCANAMLSLPAEARTIIVRNSTRSSLRRALHYLEIQQNEFGSESRLIVVSPTTYMLWREAGLRPLIDIYSGFADEANRAQVSVLALAFPGSGNMLRPQSSPYFSQSGYQLRYQPILPQLTLFIGHRVSQSSQTWEDAIYAPRSTGTSGP